MKIKSLKGEIWKPIPDSNDEYFASNLYRVKSVKNGQEKLIGIYTQKNKYRRVTISVGGNVKHILYHRLIAILFISNPENYPCVLHLDDNPSNCNLTNLQWGTFSDNTKQAYERGRMSRKGTKNSMNKLSEAQVLEIHLLDMNYAVIAKQFNISKGAVSDIKQGLRWAWLTGGKAAKRVLTGINSGTSILNDEQVMRLIKETGTLAEISSKYGVSGTTVWDIKNGKSWSWLTGIKYLPKHPDVLRQYIPK